jgi:two-component system chemotaxis response regulator CheB
VDVLFNSAVKAGAAPHSLALLLTGMGSDGATGMLELQNGGSQTVAQDENTCVVFGMPREAIRLGAAQQVLPLQQMAGRIERFAAECAMKMA